MKIRVHSKIVLKHLCAARTTSVILVINQVIVYNQRMVGPGRYFGAASAAVVRAACAIHENSAITAQSIAAHACSFCFSDHPPLCDAAGQSTTTSTLTTR